MGCEVAEEYLQCSEVVEEHGSPCDTFTCDTVPLTCLPPGLPSADQTCEPSDNGQGGHPYRIESENEMEKDPHD